MMARHGCPSSAHAVDLGQRSSGHVLPHNAINSFLLGPVSFLGLGQGLHFEPSFIEGAQRYIDEVELPQSVAYGREAHVFSGERVGDAQVAAPPFVTCPDFFTLRTAYSES